jgi:hypothetical protein
MWKSIAVPLVITAMLAPLAACSDPPPESGIVVAREYDDPDQWTESVADYAYLPRPYTRTSYNYSSACKCSQAQTTSGVEMVYTVVSWHNENRSDGPHWKLKIQDDKDPKNLGWVEVTQQDYDNKYMQGYHWPDLR